MTVADLIEHLNALPKDAKVFVSNDHANWDDDVRADVRTIQVWDGEEHREYNDVVTIW